MSRQQIDIKITLEAELEVDADVLEESVVEAINHFGGERCAQCEVVKIETKEERHIYGNKE